MSNGAVHIVIPDTQVKDGVPLNHLTWIGRYIVDRWANKPNVKIIHLGDHWDMPSLSSYDRKGGTKMEGRRVAYDIAAGIDGFGMLNEPFEVLNSRHRKRWRPDRVFLLGNHENRISRAIENDAQMDGLLDLNMLDTGGWETYPFLQPVFLDGVGYSHYWYNPMSGNPYAGMIETRLKNVGHTFTMGHQQTLMYGVRFVAGRSQHGLVAGACYLHEEDYKGPQGNAHWRGIIVKHEVRDGSYDPMFVSLDYLCRRYEGVSLHEFLRRNGYDDSSG